MLSSQNYIMGVMEGSIKPRPSEKAVLSVHPEHLMEGGDKNEVKAELADAAVFSGRSFERGN